MMTEPFGYFSVNDYSDWEQTDSENGRPLYDQATIDLLKKEIESEQRWASFYAQESMGRASEIDTLKAALREAKEALVMNIVGTGGRTPAAHNAIATINKVLGEE